MGMMLIYIFDHKIKENGPYSVVVRLNPNKINSYKIRHHKKIDTIETFRNQKKQRKNILIQKIKNPTKNKKKNILFQHTLHTVYARYIQKQNSIRACIINK